MFQGCGELPITPDGQSVISRLHQDARRKKISLSSPSKEA